MSIYIIIIFVFAAVVAFTYFYTRPVPISTNRPYPDNAAKVSELFKARRVVFIGAHPDDIEFYCGGLIYQLRKGGIEVSYIIGTRGGKGRNGHAKIALETQRTKDQLEAARIIGGVDVKLFDYPDKDLGSFIKPFAEDIAMLINQKKPDLVFTWDPDYIYNPHPDHQSAAQASRIALAGKDIKVCYYGTREPNLWFGFGKDVFDMNLKALRAHRTETPWYFWIFGKRFLTKKP